jgi:YaiO family outer membrane protein
MMPIYAQKVSADELLSQALTETNVNKNYEQAIQLAKQGLKISPDYLDFNLLLGRLYMLTEKYDDAIQELDKVLIKHPNQADALKYLINASYQNHDLRAAIKYANQYLQYYPNDKLMNIKKISMLNEINAFSEAKHDLVRALKESPRDSNLVYLHKEVLFNEARFFRTQKDTLAIIAAYEQLLADYPNDTLARNQLIGIEIEKHDYDNALKHVDSGLKYYPNPENLFLKKVLVLQEMGNNEEAGSLAKVLYRNNPGNKKIKSFNDELFLLNGKNQLIVNYAFTTFDQSAKENWNQYSISYMRTEKFGALIGRINYADRINNTGYQFELEAYPKHAVGYSFVNFSFAKSTVFPKLRWSYSYFLPLNKGWGTEIGFRYLKSDAGYLGLTGAVDKYINRYWLNLKTFFMFDDQRLTGSYMLTGRYYVNDSIDDYFTAIAGYGFSPDDRGMNFEINKRFNMQSIRFTMAYQFRLWKRNVLGVSTTFNKQQYQTGSNTNEFETAFVLKHRF